MQLLDRYLDPLARHREIVALAGAHGSILVVDRRVEDGADARLVAHLGADEPVANALLVCHEYLSDPRARWCRRLEPGDRRGDPAGPPPALVGRTGTARVEGSDHRIELIAPPAGAVELRWVCGSGRVRVVRSLRQVVAALERYTPARAMTAAAIGAGGPQTATLRAELRRLDRSPIVLNRGLREAVLAAVARGESLSEIATRCGRVKRNRHGVVSGETSWLARRVGLMPEGGGDRRCTPWIHTDTLGLIARRGLGVSPLEVEVA